MNTQQFKSKVFDLVEDEYSVLGEYVNCDTPIELKHNVCGYVWNTTTPYCFTKKNKPNRCPQCSRHRRIKNACLPTGDFYSKISEDNKEKFDVIGDFFSTNKPILIKCKHCGNEFEIKKASRLIYENVLCRECMEQTYRKHESDEWFKKRIFEQVGNEYELIGHFNGVDNYVTLKHNICGNIYDSTIGSSFLAGTRCPYCNQSKGEKKIQNYLESKCIEYEPQKTFEELKFGKAKGLSYDFYLPQYNTLVEYQGEQHSYPIKYSKDMSDDVAEHRFKIQKRNDKKKMEFAKKYGYSLLEIWHTDFNNVNNILENCLTTQEVVNV